MKVRPMSFGAKLRALLAGDRIVLWVGGAHDAVSAHRVEPLGGRDNIREPEKTHGA